MLGDAPTAEVWPEPGPDRIPRRRWGMHRGLGGQSQDKDTRAQPRLVSPCTPPRRACWPACGPGLSSPPAQEATQPMSQAPLYLQVTLASVTPAGAGGLWPPPCSLDVAISTALFSRHDLAPGSQPLLDSRRSPAGSSSLALRTAPLGLTGRPRSSGCCHCHRQGLCESAVPELRLLRLRCRPGPQATSSPHPCSRWGHSCPHANVPGLEDDDVLPGCL